MNITVLQCGECKRFHVPKPEKLRTNVPYTCDVFPDGIPMPIVAGQHDHRRAFPGDNGRLWEPVTPGRQHPFGPVIQDAAREDDEID